MTARPGTPRSSKGRGRRVAGIVKPCITEGELEWDAGFMWAAVITWDGGSNCQPFETLCQGLIGRGFSVHVLSHEAHRQLYEKFGAVFDPLPLGEKVPGFRPSVAEERERVTGVWLSSEIAHAVIRMLDTARFDVAVVDVSMLAAFVGCEANGTPFVAVHHSLPGAAWSGPRRSQFESFVEPVNTVRESLGLPVVSGFSDIMSAASAHLVPTAVSLDSPVPWTLPLHYVGPLQPAPARDEVPDLPPRFVLVSFSTTWQRQIDVLQRTIDALGQLDRAVVVTTGPSIDPSELRSAANTVVFASLPHGAILDRADVVVTHAGHGTVLSALTAGAPLVCIPMGRDQHDVASRVVAAGAGVELDPADIDRSLLTAVQQIIGERRFAEAAATIAESVAQAGGIEAALAVIEGCARGGGSRRREP